MSDKLFALVGRKQARIEELEALFQNTLGALAQVVSGAVCPSRVLVNLTEGAWLITPAGQTPCTPATVNGLPVCVVGVAPPPAQAPAEAPQAEEPAPPAAA